MARSLRERAESYATDAGVLRQNGATDDALVYEAIRDELRKLAGELDTGQPDPMCACGGSALFCECPGGPGK